MRDMILKILPKIYAAVRQVRAIRRELHQEASPLAQAELRLAADQITEVLFGTVVIGRSLAAQALADNVASDEALKMADPLISSAVLEEVLAVEPETELNVPEMAEAALAHLEPTFRHGHSLAVSPLLYVCQNLPEGLVAWPPLTTSTYRFTAEVLVMMALLRGWHIELAEQSPEEPELEE